MGCRAIAFSCLITALASSCASVHPATEVVVFVDAEPGVRGATRSLRVQIEGSSGRSGDPFTQREQDDLPSPSWPVRVALTPLDGDGQRVYRVTASALDGATPAALVSQVRVISGYRSQATLRIDLLLDDACRGHAPCADDQTCSGGTCVMAMRDPASLAPFDSDAARPSTDAAPYDAGTDVPAPVDTGIDAPPADMGVDAFAGVDASMDVGTDAFVPTDVGTDACASCPAATSWTIAWGLGDPGTSEVSDAVVDDSGNTYVAGYSYGGDVVIDGVTLHPTSNPSEQYLYLMRIDPVGTIGWMHTFGFANGATSSQLALGADGMLSWGLQWQPGASAMGWPTIMSSGTYIASFGTDGSVGPIYTFGSSIYTASTRFSDADLLILGASNGTYTIGTCTGTSNGPYVVRLHPDGSCAWSVFRVGGTTDYRDDAGNDIAMGPDESWCAIGRAQDLLDTGTPYYEQSGAWIECRDATGAMLWSHNYPPVTTGGSHGRLQFTRVVRTADRTYVMGAYDNGTFTGSAPVPPSTTLGVGMIPLGSRFVIAYDGSGTALWQRIFTNSGTNPLVGYNAIDVDPATGDLWIAGSYQGSSVSLGGTPFPSTLISGSTFAFYPFVATYDATNRYVSAVSYTSQSLGIQSLRVLGASTFLAGGVIVPVAGGPTYIQFGADTPVFTDAMGRSGFAARIVR